MAEKKEKVNSSLAVIPEIVPTSAISEITKAEIDIQISTAKKYPRSVAKFRQDAMSMATMDQETAASCFYALERGGKKIEGPSIRLAEICASAWGNLRYGARIVEIGGKEVTSQGVAHDLETNVGSNIEIKRRITNKEGERFSDDMITVTCNAANSIAARNAILKVVPRAYVNIIYLAAKKAAVGSMKTLKQRRDDMFTKFEEAGVKKEQVLAYVKKASVEDVGLAEVELLIGTYTAIKDGDSSAEQVFGSGKNLKPSAGVPQAKSSMSNSAQHEIIRKLCKKAYGEKAGTELLRTLGEDYGGIEKLEELTSIQAENLIQEIEEKTKNAR